MDGGSLFWPPCSGRAGPHAIRAVRQRALESILLYEQPPLYDALLRVSPEHLRFYAELAQAIFFERTARNFRTHPSRMHMAMGCSRLRTPP